MSSASSAVSPPPWNDAAYESSFWSLILDDWPSGHPASWAEPEIFKQQVIAGAMPDLNTITAMAPCTASGCTATSQVDYGWKITRSGADTRWFHLTGNIGSTKTVAGLGVGDGTGTLLTINSMNWQFTQIDSGTSGFPTGFVYVIDPVMTRTGTNAYSSGSTTSPIDCSTADTGLTATSSFAGTPCSAVSVDSANSMLAFYNAEHTYLAGLTLTHSTDCPQAGYCRLAVWWSDDAFENALIHSGSVVWTSQAATFSSSTFSIGATPTSPVLTAMRSWLTGATAGYTDEYNCVLDPSHWNCASDSAGTGGGSGGGGSATTFVMPDCRNVTTAVCDTRLGGAGYNYSFVVLSALDAAHAASGVAAGNVASTDPPAGATVATTYTVTLYTQPTGGLIVLPKPGSNEIGTAYAARLVALGYTGTVSYLTAGTTLTSYGPGAVIALGTIPGASCGTITTASWPTVGSPCLRIDPALALTITNNTSSPTAGTTEPGPGAGGGGSCDGYLTASFDMSPLTGAGGSSLATKFPFSVFDNLGYVLTGLLHSGAAPSIPYGAYLFGGHSYTQTIDLSEVDPMMPVIRVALTLVLTFGIFWAFGTAMMGLNFGRGGGDE